MRRGNRDHWILIKNSWLSITCWFVAVYVSLSFYILATQCELSAGKGEQCIENGPQCCRPEGEHIVGIVIFSIFNSHFHKIKIKTSSLSNKMDQETFNTLSSSSYRDIPLWTTHHIWWLNRPEVLLRVSSKPFFEGKHKYFHSVHLIILVMYVAILMSSINHWDVLLTVSVCKYEYATKFQYKKYFQLKIYNQPITNQTNHLKIYIFLSIFLSIEFYCIFSSRPVLLT